LQQAEIEQLNEQIRSNNGTIRDREALLKSRIRKLQDLKKNKTGLTVEELARHNASLKDLEDEARRLDRGEETEEFTVDEQDIAHEENVLQFKVINAQIDQSVITQINGGR
jgi:hypothetical protein